MTASPTPPRLAVVVSRFNPEVTEGLLAGTRRELAERGVPLAEDLESYDVQILDGAAIKRTLTSSTTSVLYAAAQQTTDWGAPLGPGQTLAIRIFQLSNRLGRGTPAAVTLQF